MLSHGAVQGTVQLMRDNVMVDFLSNKKLRPVNMLLAATVAASALTAPAHGQNLIGNSGFEDTLQPNFGNNFPGRNNIQPWVIGDGNSPNVVRVDSTDRQGNLRIQVIVDATDAAPGVDRHYLDIAGGANDFYQTFTVPLCPGPETAADYTLSGFFSTRGGDAGMGEIALRAGEGPTGVVFPGSLLAVSLPAQANPANFGNRGISRWSQVSTTISLPLGTQFSYVVSMDNQMNFDEASLVRDPAFNCVPIANNDESLGNTFAQPVVVPILDNDDEVDGTLDPETVNLIAPPGITPLNVVTDADGDTIGFDIPGEGTFLIDPVTGDLTFTPVPGFVGNPSVPSYTVRDDDGAVSPNPPATVTITVTPPAPAIELIKSVGSVSDTSGNGIFGDIGDTINFVFTVSNRGDTALAGITVDDVGLAGVVLTQPANGFDGDLVVGEFDVIAATATYVIDADDIAARQVTNTATVTSNAVASDTNGIPVPGTPLVSAPGTPLPAVTDTSDTGTAPAIGANGATTPVPNPAGNGVSDPTILTLPVPIPDIELIKSVVSVVDTNGSGFTDAGDTVTFSFSVENTGAADLTDITVTDGLVGLTFTTPNTIATLAQTATDTSIMATYVLDADDVTAGFVQNTASATGTAVDVNGVPIDDPNNPGNPLTITDTSDAGTAPAIGSPTVTDPEDNETADGAGNTNNLTDDDPTVFVIAPLPSIVLVKSVGSVTDTNNNSITDAGDVVNFTFSVTNNGTVDLQDVVVTDVLVAVTGSAINLAAGATNTTNFTAQYTLLLSDITAGGVQNTANVTATAVDAAGIAIPNAVNGGQPTTVSQTSDAGTQPNLDAAGNPVVVGSPEANETPDLAGNTDGNTANDPTVLIISNLGAIELVKSVSSITDTNGNNVLGDPGDVLAYSFTVTNTGPVPLVNINVTDADAIVSGTVASLAVGASDDTSITATRVLTPADSGAGFAQNSALVSATPVDENGVPIPAPGGGPAVVNDTSDAGTLPDLDAGNAPVLITDPAGTESPDGLNNTDTDPTNDPTVFTVPTPAPALTVTKSIVSVTDVNANNLIDTNDIVTYVFNVTNTGTTSLADVSISDPLLNISSVAVTPSNLAPGDTAQLTGQTYTIQDTDVTAGGVENTATAAGRPVATGAGNVADPATALVDAAGNALPNAVDTSDSGTQPNLDNGGAPVAVINSETTETANLDGTTDQNTTNDPTVLNIAAPQLTVTKSVSNVFDTNNSNLFGDAGDIIEFSFFVRNTGNVNLTNVLITDTFVDSVSGGPIDLAVGAASSNTFTASYTVLPGDVSAGFFQNSATATGAAVQSDGTPITGPNGTQVTVSDVSDAGTQAQQQTVGDPENTETVDGAGQTDGNAGNDPTVQFLPTNPNPSITVIKSVSGVIDTNMSGQVDAGDLVNYSFTVTNTGNVRLDGVAIDDPRAPVTGGPVLLEVDQIDTTTFTATATITPDEAAAGAIENTAVATGNVVNSVGVPINDVSTGQPLTATDTSDTGTEPELGATGVPAAIADPAATGAGDADSTILAILNPSLELIKSVALVEDSSADGVFGNENDVITYSFIVRNTGNTSITGIAVTDPNAVVSGGPITLAAGASDSTTFTATRIITGPEFVAGFVENTAETTGSPEDANGDVVRGPDGTPVAVVDTSDTGTDAMGDPVANPGGVETVGGNNAPDGNTTNDPTVITVPTNPVPAVQLVKSVASIVDADNDAVLGGVDDIITYNFVVTNTGNTALANVVVNDPLLGGPVGTIALLAIRETQTLTGTYTIVAADEVNGFVQNSATVSGLAVNDAGAPITQPGNGPQLTASDISDSGTERDTTPITGPEGVETPQNDGTTDTDPTNDPTVVNVPLTPSDAAISGTVFLDSNRNGTFEPGLDIRQASFQVILRDGDGNIVVQTVTDAQGEFAFAGFGVGPNFRLEFVDPTTGEIVGTIANLNFARDTVFVNQNQPVLRVLPATTLIIEKTSPVTTVIVGQTVPYQISITNQGGFTVENVTVSDRLPAGLLYTPGSAAVNGVAVEPSVAGPVLTWADLTVPAGEDTVVVTLNARVSSAAGLGELTNVATTLDSVTGIALSPQATATVVLRPEAIFDCSDIIGKVFDDRNANGYQDEGTARGEPGLAHVRLVTQTGSIITTDEFGRYSVPCAELPGKLGANFSLKLDERSLPSGYRVTTENPRTMRVTAGILTEMNFGASISRIVDIDLTSAAFVAGSAQPSDALSQGLDGLLNQIVDTPSVIRIAYFHEGEEAAAIRARGNAVEKMIRDKWKKIGRYKLIVERTAKRMQ